MPATYMLLNTVLHLQVMPKPNLKDESKVDVDVMVKERPMKTADVDLSWGLAPNSHGIPLPADKFPGGSLTFENRNLGGRGNQFSASITSENFLQPNDDVGFKVTINTRLRHKNSHEHTHSTASRAVEQMMRYVCKA